MASILNRRRTSVVTNVTPTEEDSPPPASLDIHHSAQPFLQELECQDPITLQGKGMLRWAFHKNLEKDTSKATELADELVQDLEKIQTADEKACTIPLLLTLIYVIFQSVYLPVDLCERAYAACKSLLKLPKPYCSVGLACLRHMQTERSKPGALYQRTVIAEQNLWSKFQEMVFVFADAAVFSGPLGNAVQSHLEAAGFRQPSVTHMRAVLQHTLQAALGNCCHGNALARALKDMGRSIEPYFQEVVRTVERNAEEARAGDRDRDKASGYRDRLQRLYRQIMSAADEGEPSLCDTPLAPPKIRYHLWQEDDEEPWVQVEKWVQRRSAEGPPEACRASQVSRDSGIERDLLENEALEASPGATKEDQQQQQQQQQGRREPQAPPDGSVGEPRLFRRPCTKKRSGRSSSLADDTNGSVLCQYTACVVVMGDDRALGRLAKAYHTLRAGGSRFFSLNNRVNLEIYYIPVTDQHTTTSSAMEGTPPVQSYLDLASHLGRVDPWYECNINSLAHWIPTLVESANARSSWDPNPFLLDVLSYYKRTAWQPIHFTIYSVKISSSDPKKSLEQVFLTHLAVEFAEGRNTNESSLQICGPVVSITYKKVSLSGRQVDKGKSVRTTGILISALPAEDTEDPDPDQLTLRFKETQTRTSTESVIQSRNIKIKTVENRTFTVCLDKDSRRTYEDVRSIEISPCRDPQRILNTHIAEPSLSLSKEKGAEPSKHMTNGLSLPINIFSGISH